MSNSNNYKVELSYYFFG